MKLLAAAVAATVAGACGATPPVPPPPPPPAPISDEAMELGQRLAASGDFQAIVNAAGHAEIQKLAAETPALSDAERERLRTIGMQRLSSRRTQLTRMVGEIYARRFSVEDLRAIVGFFEGPAGRSYTSALPRMLPEIAGAMQGIDLKADVMRDFCAETGKGCPAGD